MLGLLAVSCGGTAAKPRGWAEPVESGKTVMVSSSRGKISGIDSDTNLLKWQFPNSWNIQGDNSDLKGIYGAPVIASDGNTTFIGDYNGIVYAFNQNDGTVTGEKKPAFGLELKDPIIGGVAIDKSAGMLFVTTGDRVVRIKYTAGSPPSLALDPNWVVETGEDIWSVPVINGDRILFSSLDGKLYSVSRTDASDRWTYDPDGSGLVSTPAIIGNTVYVGGFDSKLHAVDLASGTEKWNFQASYWIWNTPISDGTNVVFGDFNGRLYSVNQSDGSETWQLDLGKGPIVGSPVLAQGTLVVGTQDGWLVGVDTATRQSTWETKLPTSFTADLIASANGSTVLIAPRGCVTPEGQEQKAYYFAVNPTNGELKEAQNLC
jgi:hypothetical protein